MQNVKISPYVSEDVAARLRTLGDYYGMSGPQMAALILTEFSRIDKGRIFSALSSIPADMKSPTKAP